jgi:hypothetical protein
LDSGVYHDRRDDLTHPIRPPGRAGTGRNGSHARRGRVYLTWGHVASGCGLSSKRRRFRWTLDAVPVMASMTRRTAALVEQKHRVQRMEIDRSPRIGLLRPTRLDWKVRIRLVDGQVPGDYATNAERLATPGACTPCG